MIDDGEVAIGKAVSVSALTLVDGRQIEQHGIGGIGLGFLDSGGRRAGFAGRSKAWLCRPGSIEQWNH